MQKKYLVLLMFAIQGHLFGAAKQEEPKIPQPGYWYNDTDSVIKVSIIDQIEVTFSSTLLEPYELVKMKPFKMNQLSSFMNTITLAFQYHKKDSDQLYPYSGYLSGDSLADFGSEYIVVFRNDPFLSYRVIPEKEFRDKYAKALEAYPVPGGVQRIISGYVLPSTEKSKCGQE